MAENYGDSVTVIRNSQIENMLVLQAFSVVEDGHIAIPLFERLERDIAAIGRAEEVLKRNGVHTIDDLEKHFQRVRPMTKEKQSAKGVAR